MSPTMPTFRPSKSCPCAPRWYTGRAAPAWDAGACRRPRQRRLPAYARQSMRGAPACLSRTTIMSILYALSVSTVSMRLSPFTELVEEPPKFRLSARKALLCQLKRRTRARGRLVEHVHDREALERGDLLDLALIDLGQRFGRLENRHDVGIGILIDVDEMLVFESHTTYSPPSGAACARSPGFISRISTADVPSTSSRNRRTFSSRDEGTFLPT